VGKSTKLALAGFCAIAVAFGPARNGYGLFLPDFRREFGLSVEVSGFIASGLHAGYLIALTVVGLVAARAGPRPLVVIGGLSAACGMVLVSLAPNAAVLAAGVILAGTSAGWSWAPYNDAADRMVPPALRGRVLSVISTGTTFGILVAGLVALAAGAAWRVGWLAFAAAALVAVAWNAGVLVDGRHAPDGKKAPSRPVRSLGVGWFVRSESAPLFSVAFSFGVVSAFYWAFAVDHVARAGGFPAAAGLAFYAVLGVAGFAGLFTGDLIGRYGLRRVLLTILVSLGGAAALLGAAPAWWPAVAASAVLYGADVMLMSALLAVWSSAVFAEQPATGFSATLFLFGVGSVVGPAALGAFAGRFGLDAAFLLAGALALTGALLPPKEDASTTTPDTGTGPEG
jgi:predicted MFS family arabinose efflux permease